MAAALLVALALVAGGCAAAGDPQLPGAPGQDDGAAANAGGGTSAGVLTIVLPPAELSAPVERVRVRMLVDRAVEASIVRGDRPVLIEPATADALGDAVELAVRRSDTVCVMGREAQSALVEALALYPSRTACLIPAHGIRRAGWVGVDIDLDEVGRTLGAAARSVARDGTVVVLDGKDGMLDRRWAAGVRAGVVDGGGVDSRPVVTVSSAGELFGLIDALAAEASDLPPDLPPDRSSDAPSDDRLDVPTGALPPVQVVVLDASAASAEAVDVLLGRGLQVIAPRSLLAERTDHPGVVMNWRLRWDVALTVLLRLIVEGRTSSGEGVAGVTLLPTADVLTLEPGPAAAPG